MVRSKVRKLKDLLVNSHGDDIEIIEENYKMLTPPGEHYGSIMLAVEVAIKKPHQKIQVLNLVAKLIPVSEMLRMVFNINVTFKKEVSAYLNTIPALIQLQHEYNVPESRILNMFPKCYGARLNLDGNENDVDENAVILFENLKTQGYAMEDRLVGFNLEDAKLIIKDLANFHSVAIALRKLKPDVFKEKVGPTIVKGPTLADLPSTFNDCIIQHAATIEELQPFMSRLHYFIKKSVGAIKKPSRPLNDTFSTTIHGDFWVNNTMVLKDSNRNPIKNKMVDLQLMALGSPVRDLIFFLFTSVKNSVLEKHYDEFVELYYDEFMESMRYFDLDLKEFAREAFLREIDVIAPHEAYHVILMVQLFFAERNVITNSLEDFDENDWNKSELLGEAFRTKLKNTVLAFAQRNWI